LIAHPLNNINKFFNRNIRIHVCNVKGNKFWVCIIWDFNEIIKIKCVMLFTLKTWGSGKYDSRLLAVIVASVHCGAFAQLTMGPIGALAI